MNSADRDGDHLAGAAAQWDDPPVETIVLALD
jgi:hypothetical protein